MLEIEIKIRVSDAATAKARLTALGAEIVRERHREDNILFDFPDRRLRGGHQALRLRRAGRRTYVTFKGAPQKSRRFKVREEIETEVRDAGRFRRILQALGLHPVFRYAKMRAEYRLGRVTVCLDELPLGTFLELEGERQHIVKLAERLGVPSKDWIKLSYVRLLIEAGYPNGTAAYSSSCSSPPPSSDDSSSSSSPSSRSDPSS